MYVCIYIHIHVDGCKYVCLFPSVTVCGEGYLLSLALVWE